MKFEIDISKYVGKNGRYLVENNGSFERNFNYLELKHISMMLRLHRMNELCKLHVKEWEKRKEYWRTVDYAFSFLQEEIIYHMRRAVDDMISIAWIQNEFDNNRHVSKIHIDSIGKYLSQQNKTISCFDECVDFMNIINKISNSYKHSVFQTVQIFVDKHEPGFYLYTYQSNDTNKGEEEKFYYQSDILEELEKMLTVYLKVVYEKENTN